MCVCVCVCVCVRVCVILLVVNVYRISRLCDVYLPVVEFLKFPCHSRSNSVHVMIFSYMDLKGERYKLSLLSVLTCTFME